MSLNTLFRATACLLVVLLATGEATARGGRGGGGGGARMGGGGGGGARMGGGSMGGGYRGPSPSMPSRAPRPASPSVNRSPSMSRPASAARGPSPVRSAQPDGLGGSAGRGSVAGAGSRGPAVSGRVSSPGAGQAALRSPSSFNRPSTNDLNSFLGIAGGAAAGAAMGSNRAAASARGAEQLGGGDGGSRTFTTERGGTITVGGRGGSTEVGGGTVGAGVGGIKVETAGGATIGKVGGAAGASGSSGAAIRGGSVSGATGSRGSIANVSRGYADTAGNRAGGSVTAAKNRAGYTGVNVRGGYASGGVGQIGSISAVRGPGGNVISAGRGASFVNGQFVGGRSWAAVNGAYTRWNCFTPGWRGAYPGAWWPGKWAVRTTAWAALTWPYASAYYGATGEPMYYDYGNNVAYEDGTVYVDDQPAATAEEYYQQADEIADSGANTTNEDWLPIGVFAVIADENQAETDKVVQLAINRDGIIRGNYQDLLTDKVTPINGAVDKETQRVSLKLEGNDKLIIETGLYNLTNDEAPVLVHFGPDRQEGRVFIRLKQPEDQAAADSATQP